MENQGKSGNKTFVVISIILFLLSSFLGWQLYNIKNEKETIIVEKTKVETDFTAVKADFDEIKKAYDELQTDNKQLQSELDSKKEELEDLGIQLDKYKGDAVMVKKLKRELETIRNLIKSYLHDIDSLQIANQGLTNENTQVKTELKTEKGRSEQLTTEKNSLTQKVDLGSKLKAYQLFADAVRVKGSDKEITTTKAKRADRIRACFTLSENKIARKENKTVFMKVTAPGDEILVTSTDDSNMFTSNGEKQYYSAKKDIFYEQEAKQMCLAFTKKEDVDFKAGKYKVELFVDGTSIGSSTFELK
jgi:FtsZ-binding cell division protein ZapB